jgi:hypothetical protein
MSKEEAEMHIKRQYQKLFQRDGVAEELRRYMGNVNFYREFKIDTLKEFYDKAKDLENSDIYGFINVK